MAAVNIYPQYSQEEFLGYMRQHSGGDHVYIYEGGDAIARAFEVQSTGITVLIDKDGRIAGQTFPPGLVYEDLKRAVDQLLQ